MELYATGFNAWNQLRFGGPDASPESQDPDDLHGFKLVLRNSSFEPPHASLSCTLVKTPSSVLFAGYPDDWVKLHDLRDKMIQCLAAIAGNGIIAVYSEGSVQQYQSLAHYKAMKGRTVLSDCEINQIVAYETGFAALSAGQVWTWGDERYCACLGREVSESSPAEKPCLVIQLEGLPTGRIRKLAAAGYLLTAITEGDDLYAWGGHPGRPVIIEGISGSPSPVLVEENDIRDCAVGEFHVIVLTSHGDIFVIGDNVNGQLGYPIEKASSWTRVPGIATGSTISAVVAGLRSSFIVVVIAK
ncbi:regulator of chromosome condensation 1/beta-lactamase-inhibitor protein II [Pseudomassariella vexata]|uniref:Regulator of chromosome condensation 1/beta-lactamase-inhibitor protein II n=1 Tax=Pseudomassariella vexata TaxID=1141098 RepID=A0A1Y2DAI0_9PEZI|nr:regulator of chromosome condensation 1/beta-lactamase-inhibitor protein II [Pseudomassariella vexata]ORY56116.1 regulator of chromosome condensation 1/beta-lactamase-inhibitor protein II [Pseudomassariella vexata]